MQKKPLPPKIDTDLAKTINDIFTLAQGIPVKLKAVPTLATMEPDTWGYYGQTIYFKFGDGTGISITGNPLA